MSKPSDENLPAAPSLANATTLKVHTINGSFAYRTLGAPAPGQLPLVGLIHLGANLDSWDPALIDPLAAQQQICLIGYRGVGQSTGKPQDNFEQMAQDAIDAIRALGLSRVNLLGLSMGGMVAQEIIRLAPELVNRLVLAGAGPQGGPGLTSMTPAMLRGMLRAALSLANPTSVLFFTRTPSAKKAAGAYQARLKAPRIDQDKAVSPKVMISQLRAVKNWGQQPLGATSLPEREVLILHGDSDGLVPSKNAEALKTLFPQASHHMYPDSGHGVTSQHPENISQTINNFLKN